MGTKRIIRYKVKEIAEQQGKTLSDLSYDSRVSRQQLYPIWRNESQGVMFKTLLKLADALGVSAENLIEEVCIETKSRVIEEKRRASVDIVGVTIPSTLAKTIE
jgi:transcriptional regulator with XRE-family HTH domain